METVFPKRGAHHCARTPRIKLYFVEIVFQKGGNLQFCARNTKSEKVYFAGKLFAGERLHFTRNSFQDWGDEKQVISSWQPSPHAKWLHPPLQLVSRAQSGGVPLFETQFPQNKVLFLTSARKIVDSSYMPGAPRAKWWAPPFWKYNFHKISFGITWGNRQKSRIVNFFSERSSKSGR